LSRVVALIDATPPELSLRMQHLENALVGQQKLVLTTSPSRIVMALGDNDRIQHVGIWTMPYEGFIVRNRLQQNQQGFARLALEHSLFDGRQTPLFRARLLHLRGQYEDREDRPGARSLYLDCRPTEQQIRAVADIPLRTAEGEPAAAATAEQKELHRRRLEAVQVMMSRTKENATYWLGLMALDRGQYDVSIDFLERLLKISPNTPWQPGARYNLARAFEARGRASGQTADLNRAHEIYSSQTLTPTAAACQLRAKRLSAELPN
jgi:tetratricopeptide (TPR) repeat protein